MSSYASTPAFGNFGPLGFPEYEKEMLHAGFQAVDSVEGGWEFLRTYEPPADQGFMFSLSTGKRLEIDNAISNRYGGHSGSSYGWTMRNLEAIAKKGWDTWAEEVLQQRKQGPAQTLLQQARNLDNFIASTPPTDNLVEFANALQQDPGMRRQIPDIDEQAAALKRFAEGKLSYAEMRSLCG